MGLQLCFVLGVLSKMYKKHVVKVDAFKLYFKILRMLNTNQSCLSVWIDPASLNQPGVCFLCCDKLRIMSGEPRVC